jgi:hypothetical protein
MLRSDLAVRQDEIVTGATSRTRGCKYAVTKLAVNFPEEFLEVQDIPSFLGSKLDYLLPVKARDLVVKVKDFHCSEFWVSERSLN